MISLKKYLESVPAASDAHSGQRQSGQPLGDVVSVALAAYGSALVAMGSCSLDACPALGSELRQNLGTLSSHLCAGIDSETLARRIGKLGSSCGVGVSAQPGITSERAMRSENC